MSIDINESHKHTIKKFFEATNTHWTKVYEENTENSIYKYAFIKRRELVKNIINAHTDGKHIKILDAGCGSGMVTRMLSEEGHDVIGIDITETLVRETSNKLLSFGNGSTKCCRSDIEALPFKTGAFDVLVSLGVLQYLASDHMSLSEFSRVTKPNGLVIVCIPNKLKINVILDPYNYIRFLSYLLKRFLVIFSMNPVDSKSTTRLEKDYMRKYFPWQLKRLFSKYGLKKSALFGVDYGPFTIRQKSFLPNSISMKINLFLDKCSQKRCLTWIKLLSSQWVVVFKKTEIA
jgi:ubiquinone/menaquinone biosynthesis C-methylase UbiE